MSKEAANGRLFRGPARMAIELSRETSARYGFGVNALPPGPRSMLWTTYRVATEPIATMAALREEYGDPFYAPMANGGVVITADPELIQTVFANRDTELFSPFASEAMDAFVGRQSLLLIDGEAHKRERKLLSPPFHGERMRAYATVMAEATREAFAGLGDGEAFLAIDRGTDISLETIVRAVFGVEARAEIDKTGAALRATLDAAKPAFLFSKRTQVAPFGLGPWARYRELSDEVDRLLYAHIAAVREHSEGREDILALMLSARDEQGEGMSDEHIRDELRTLLIAGHETTAITLAWALYAIHRHPEVRERLQAELDALGPDATPEAIAQLPYLGAVVDETLRLHPIVEVAFRVLRKPWRFGEYELPAGVTIAPAIALVHRRPDLYPEPAAFRPERFLTSKPKPYEYLPFGGGNRRCIGAAFSLFESRIAIGTILRELELELLDTEELPPVRRSITLGPKGGVRMRVVRRRTLG
jgi:cytochrome P450 family 110